MSERTPAGEKGTADRIEADDRAYWVRLVTKQALKREGVVMGNCLDSQGYGEHLVGNEDMVSDGFWSLRKADGLSYLLVEIDTWSETRATIDGALGPKNSQPSGWSVRQLRHLVAAFRAAGATLRVPKSIALTDEDGLTWRPDKAPQALRAAVEPPRLEQVLTRNDDGTFDFRQTGPGVERVFPGVRLERREETIEGGMHALTLTTSKRHRFGGPVYARALGDPDGYYRTRLFDDVEAVELRGRVTFDGDAPGSRGYLATLG
ncbi:hypothetical protein MKK58_17615 [Methylobacterium sp. J-078]|uniref:hypothetical protein n=1 Tax=Methylobacterium sp. J-078 TaxID=2836657 RepID=UPI001FB93EEB|nr:hypothetical protein [Methylobacterium sp. J-078]MCJ2046336.1 hypothetical protein [Methylobacterium sp. J-078]